MRAFSLKRTAASYFLWLVVAFEILRQVVAFFNFVAKCRFLDLMASCRLWQVVDYGKLS